MKKVEKINLHVPCWVYQNDQGISHKVCNYYVDKYKNHKTETAKTENKNKKEVINRKARDVKKIDIPPFTGVASYLIAAALDANFQNWKYDITFCSQAVYLIYKRNGKYTSHVDYSFSQNQEYVRKLTCLTILNDDFKGGLFYLIDGSGEKFFPPQKKGNIIIFPSYSLHGCETVYEGQRHAVVAWMNGKPLI